MGFYGEPQLVTDEEFERVLGNWDRMVTPQVDPRNQPDWPPAVKLAAEESPEDGA